MNQKIILGLTVALVILVLLSSSMFAEGEGGPGGGLGVTEEYKNVTLGETFTVSAETDDSHKWILKNYDTNYLDKTGLLDSAGCGASSGDPEPTCTYVFPFKAIKEGQTTIELNKINISNNITTEIKYVYLNIISIPCKEIGSECSFNSECCSNTCVRGREGLTGFCKEAYTGPSCADSDDGRNYYEKGHVFGLTDFGLEGSGKTIYIEIDDLCEKNSINPVNVNNLFEYSCSGGYYSSETYTCPNGCENGACIGEYAQCTDSDGGKNYYEKGYCKDNISETNYMEDSCIPLDSPNIENRGKLYETWCDDTSEGYQCVQLPLECPMGYVCKNGACIIKDCTDSDGGKFYYVKGTVKKGEEFRNDFCLVAGGTFKYVNEYFCENNEIKSEIFGCPNVCDNGACIKSEKPDAVIVDAHFTPTNPEAGKTVRIYVKHCIHNLDLGKSIDNHIKIYDGDPDLGGKLLYEAYDSVGYESNCGSIYYDWRPSQGSHTVFALVDPDNNIDESNEYNNEVKKYIFVGGTGCSNHAQCSQACDNLGISSHWKGSGSARESWEGTCPSNVYGCMTGKCCIGQCLTTTTGECVCRRTTRVDIYGDVCPVGMGCGIDCYCHEMEEIKSVYLDNPFTLIVGQKAEVIDYKNMIVELKKLESLEGCPIPKTRSEITPECVKGWRARVSVKLPGDVSETMWLGLGGIRHTGFGVDIRFDGLRENSAVFEVTRGAEEFKFNVKTDRYWYSAGERVRIESILVGDPSIDFSNSKVMTHVVDTNGKTYEVEMRPVGVVAPTCGESLTTGTYTCARINEYHFVGVFNIPSHASLGLYNVRSTALLPDLKKAAATSFKVGETHSRNVDISIIPERQVTSIGEKVVYKVTVTDKHPPRPCPVKTTEPVYSRISGATIAGEAEKIVIETEMETEEIQPCTIQIYNYLIDVHGLPYHTIYPTVVSVPAGGSKTFELKVYTGPVKTAQGITTAVTKTKATEIATTEERAVSITGQPIAAKKLGSEPGLVQPAPVNDALFRFTVKATLKEDSTVSDSALGILHVRYIQTPEPPPFPDEETINIKLKKGWNLVSLPGKGVGFTQGTCSAIQKPLAYIYLPKQKSYATIEEAVRVMGTEGLLEYISTHAFWIYSYEYCDIGFKVRSYSTYSGLAINRGWNLLGITKDMVGETLSNIKGSCEFENIYAWNPDSQKWLKKTENDLIEEMGYGILVKATSACNLQTNVIQPPSFPEGG